MELSQSEMRELHDDVQHTVRYLVKATCGRESGWDRTDRITGTYKKNRLGS